jgi:peptidoglycan/xylan/chitin deacetylase (PgdA/CDA1 family)
MAQKIKRIVRLLLSSGLFLIDWSFGMLSRAMGRRRPPMCIVLYYHSIPSEQRGQFEDQMDILLRYSEPIAADGIFALADGKRYAVVTFDDGFESVVQNALPILRERGIFATVFVVSECLGKVAGWQRFDPICNDGEKLMSVEQLKTLPVDLISIGSHTKTHPLLTPLHGQAAMEEILESRLRLQEMLRRDIKLFSFPYGEFNRDLVTWCREAGYARVFTILPIPACSGVEGYVTGRVSVEPTDWRIEFLLKLMGAYRWQPVAFAIKRNVVAITNVFRRSRARSSAC